MKSKHWVSALSGLSIALLTLSVVKAADGTPPIIPGLTRTADGDYAGQPGNALLTELSCTACHAPVLNETLQPKKGPVLTGLFHRIQPAWATAFISDPHQVKPGTTMPDVLGKLPESQRAQVARELVAFLQSSRKPIYAPLKEDKNGDPGASNAERGYELFHTVGCVACHAPDTSEKFHQLKKEDFEDNGLVGVGPILSEWADSVPLPDLFEKYSHDSLTKFLLNPSHSRPSGRMPSLKLNVVEAADVAHYLLREKTVQTRPSEAIPAPELVEKGKSHFVQFGCVECHQHDADFSQIDRPAYERLVPERFDGGCLDVQSAHRPVEYHLTDAQRQLIKSAITAQAPETGEQFLHRKLVTGNCYACHQRIWSDQESVGGVGARRFSYFETVGHVDFGDEGKIPPPLSGVGNKLVSTALADVLAGKRDIRPHMQARMPLFGAPVTEQLPSVFSAVDDAKKNQPVLEANLPEKDLIEAGRQLVDKGCVQCHAIQGKRMTGVVGVEMANPISRLQPEWFKEFLLNPNSKRPRTRMPNFFPQGNASVPQILEGNVEHQVTAIWTYLNHSDKAELPDKLLADEQQGFELEPNESPIRLRTFMQNVGTRAFAVGFPERVHYAFDLREVRLALAWKGRFLDAHGTWFDRFIPFASPLGNEQITLTQGVALAQVDAASGRWPDSAEAAGIRYLGYRLAKPPNTVPTIRYGNQQIKVADTLTPTETGLLRRMEISQAPSDAKWAVLLASINTSIKREGTMVHVDDKLRIQIKSGHEVVVKDGHILLILKSGDQKVEVSYQW